MGSQRRHFTTTTTRGDRSMTTETDSKHDGAIRGKRISWAEFYRQRPDLKPDNDDQAVKSNAA